MKLMHNILIKDNKDEQDETSVTRCLAFCFKYVYKWSWA